MLTAVVTGASRGLGKETAMALAAQGYNVAINYYLSDAEATKTAKKIGPSAISVKADVGCLKQVEAMADVLYKKWGKLDVLINNAGIIKDGLLVKYKESDWDDVIRINLKGCFNTIRAFTPLLLKAGGGHIINISSYSGLKGRTGQAAYSSSKSALIGLSLSMAKELAEYNIRVNTILPGYMPTEMGLEAENAMEKAMNSGLLKSLSAPDEVAGFISNLLTTRNITGQIFTLDSRI